MRTTCVHRHLTVAAGERELRSRLRVEAVEEALVDVDAVLVRGPEDDDREAVPPVVHGQLALAERQLELPIGARHRLEQELEVAREPLDVRFIQVASDQPDLRGHRPVSYTHLTLPTKR